jgi:hypothetical protein
MACSTGILRGETGIRRRSFLLSAASVLGSAIAPPAFAALDAAQQQRSATEFLNSVGLCVHLGHHQTPYYSNFDKVVELLNAVGIKHLRDDAIFATYVNRDYDFYQRVRSLVAMGFRFDLVCADPINEYIFTPPRRLPDIYDWCDRGVEIFEGANEPNLVKKPASSPAISAEHQRSLYMVVKSNARLRDVIVASPSYIQKNVDIAENLSDAVDWINLHPYPGMEHPETNGPGALDGFIAGSERVFGKKPVLISETGYHTALQTTKFHLPVSESIKTRYLPRLLLWNFINGVRRTYIYQLMDSANEGPADPESNFGLATFDFAPKASFAVVKRLLSLFGSSTTRTDSGQKLRFNLIGNPQNLLTAAFRRDDGSQLLFLWLGINGWDSAARAPRPPVTRDYVLALDPSAHVALAHQFQDDGSVSRKELSRVASGFQIAISDQLALLEIVI